MTKRFSDVFFYWQSPQVGRWGMAILRRFWWRYNVYECPLWRSWEFGPVRIYRFTVPRRIYEF